MRFRSRKRGANFPLRSVEASAEDTLQLLALKEDVLFLPVARSLVPSRSGPVILELFEDTRSPGRADCIVTSLYDATIVNGEILTPGEGGFDRASLEYDTARSGLVAEDGKA